MMVIHKMEYHSTIKGNTQRTQNVDSIYTETWGCVNKILFHLKNKSKQNKKALKRAFGCDGTSNQSTQ